MNQQNYSFIDALLRSEISFTSQAFKSVTIPFDFDEGWHEARSKSGLTAPQLWGEQLRVLWCNQDLLNAK